jgi:hypothetical protein
MPAPPQCAQSQLDCGHRCLPVQLRLRAETLSFGLRDSVNQPIKVKGAPNVANISGSFGAPSTSSSGSNTRTLRKACASAFDWATR